MEKIFNTYTNPELKKEISKTNLKRYSKMKKNEIITLMLKHPQKFKHIEAKEAKKKEPKKKEPKKKEVKKKEVKKEKIGKGIFNIFDRKLSFSNMSKKTLDKYGKCPIKQIFVTRRPLNKNIDRALNLISLGKWNKYNTFDELFHLAIVFQVDCDGINTFIKAEKSSTTDITAELNFHPDTEIKNIEAYKPYSKNVNDFIYNTLERIGKKDFFEYDAFKKNCQIFIRDLLITQDLYNNNINNFLFQDVSQIVKKLPWFSKWTAKAVTDIDSWRKKIIGKGLSESDDFHIMPDGKKMSGKKHSNYSKKIKEDSKEDLKKKEDLKLISDMVLKIYN
tara:strand:+ start:441 stop:1442 length:1002 start_codon:yes stop_codon:yes gene_type:complete